MEMHISMDRKRTVVFFIWTNLLFCIFYNIAAGRPDQRLMAVKPVIKALQGHDASARLRLIRYKKNL